MGIKCIIGIVMLIMPFVGLFAFIAKVDGWKVAVGVYGTSLGIVAWVAIAVYFLDACF